MVIRELVTKFVFKGDTAALKKFERGLKETKKVAQAASVAVSAAFAAMVIPAGTLEREIAKALAIAGKPIEEFKKNRNELAALAMDLGDDLSMSAHQISQSYYQVISTGAKLGTAEFEKFTRTANKFAKVGEMDSATAVEYLDVTRKAFNMTADEYERIADVMQKATSQGATSTAQLAESMRILAPTVSVLGEEIEDTSALIVGMAEKGLKGGEGANMISRIIARLKDANSESGKLLKTMGVKMFDNGEFVGTISLLEQLQEATSKMSQEQKSQTFLDLGGIYGEKGLSNLMSSDLSTMRTWSKELQNSTGAVDAGLEILQETGVETFGSMFQAGKNLMTVFGMFILDILKPLMREITEIAIGLRKFAQAHPGLVKVAAVIMTLVTGITLLTTAFVMLLPPILAIQSAALITFLLIAAKVALAIAAIGMLYLIIEDLVAFFTGNESMIGDFFDALIWWTNYAIREMKTAWLQFKLWLLQMWDVVAEKITGVMEPVKDLFQKILPYQNKVAQKAPLAEGAAAAANYKGSGFYRPGVAGTAGGTTTTQIKVDAPITVESNVRLSGKEAKAAMEVAVEKTLSMKLAKENINFHPVVAR